MGYRPKIPGVSEIAGLVKTGGGSSTLTLTDVAGGFTSTVSGAVSLTFSGVGSPTTITVDTATALTTVGAIGAGAILTLNAAAATTVTLSNTATGDILELNAAAITTLAVTSGWSRVTLVCANLVTVTVGTLLNGSFTAFTCTGAKLSQASVHAILDAVATSASAATVDLSGGTSAAPAVHAAIVDVTFTAAVDSDYLILPEPGTANTYAFYVDDGAGSPPGGTTGAFSFSSSGDATIAATGLANVINANTATVGYTAVSVGPQVTATANTANVITDASVTFSVNLTLNSLDDGRYTAIQTIVKTYSGTVTTN